MADDLEPLLERARSGDRDSMERLAGQIQGPIYNLALRMLWHPEDARDATQDILVRVITHLGSFRGRRLPRAQAMKRVDGNALLFAEEESTRSFAATLDKIRRLEVVRRTAALYRSSPQPMPGPELLNRILAALE